MKTVKEINTALKNLVNAYKNEKISQEETIKQFDVIIENLANILGKENKQVLMLKSRFQGAIARIHECQKLADSFAKENEERRQLRLQAGLSH